MENNQENIFDEFNPLSPEQWEEKIREDLKGADYDKKLKWKSPEGIVIKPYYTANDLKQTTANKNLPGEFPFVRGYNAMGTPWHINAFIEADDVADAGRQAAAAVAGGADAVCFAVKYLSYTHEMEALIAGIDPEKTHVHFTSSFSYSILADLYIAALQQKGKNPALAAGSFNFDSISWFLIHGEFYNSRDDNFNEAAALIRMCAEKLPAFRIISINARHFHNAGASAVQEIAFALASAAEYLDHLTNRGLSAAEVASKMQMHFAVGASYFMEIAKFRAFRLLWSKLMDAFGVTDEAALRIPVFAENSLWNKTIYDPWVNQLRATTETMSAVIGGSHSITVYPTDFVFSKPDDNGQRLARNIQNILK